MLLSKKCTRGEHILVICGNNEKIRKKLRKEFEKCPNIHIIGYTRHVPEYMDMCDVIYTKPGGLTSTEAAVKQIPIIHTKPIPGCENANLAFFVRRGMSMNANKMMTQIAQGKMLLENKEIRRGMLWAQKKNTNPHAAQDIVTLLEAITGEQPS